MNHIEIKTLSKSFNEKVVLNELSLTIQEGEFFGLLGPSGAGKTTLMKILTNQIHATSGEAKVFDCPSESLTSEQTAKMGFVFDQSGLYERLSCLDNLKLYANIHHESLERIYEVLAMVGLTDSAKKSVQRLSKGMRQRLVIARAILHHPILLFLDEPTSGLDPMNATNIHDFLLDLQRQGTTIFLTTHNMEEATKLCQHIALLNEGKIVEYGNPKELCRKYNTENEITILMKSGETVKLINKKENADQIAQYFKAENVESIHSSEPNLETVFMKLTGRGLDL